nr:tRNA (adenosine(37)-N6)-dimethylallyltransferase MiaA [Chloroflexota bacterium]
MADAPPLVVVAGATATGKTELGIRLAEAVIAGGRPAVVISADSRQVFRGLDIGTAKVTAADRARVPHHGLDLVDPDQGFSVADFARHARGVLADVGRAEGVVFLVGGTGLFLRAVARGLDTEALPTDPGIRASLEAELIMDGPAVLRERLRRQAPILAASTDLANPRRVVRALEIAAVAGDGPRPAVLGYD